MQTYCHSLVDHVGQHDKHFSLISVGLGVGGMFFTLVYTLLFLLFSIFTWTIHVGQFVEARAPSTKIVILLGLVISAFTRTINC